MAIGSRADERKAAASPARKFYGEKKVEGGGGAAPGASQTGDGRMKQKQFVRVSGLFQSKDPAKPDTYTFFVSPEMATILHEVVGGTKDNPGDMMGVSTDKKDGKPYLWIMKK